MPDVINVGVGKDYSVLDYYTMVAKCFNWKGSFEFDLSKPQGQKQKLVSVKRLNKFGWKSKISIQTATKETISYYIKRYKNAL